MKKMRVTLLPIMLSRVFRSNIKRLKNITTIQMRKIKTKDRVNPSREILL